MAEEVVECLWAKWYLHPTIEPSVTNYRGSFFCVLNSSRYLLQRAESESVTMQTDGGEREVIEERPEWEDLNTDCLVNIFSRVGMENLLLDVPYVCKSWYKVTCYPQCWTTLNFTKTSVDENHGNDGNSNFPKRVTYAYKLHKNTAVTSFIKYVVKRSNGLATFVKLPYCCTQEAMIFVSKECPNLKTLELPFNMQHITTSLLPYLVGKWKRLEKLCLSRGSRTREILAQIGTHCNKLETLEIPKGQIGKDEASALGAFVPNLKVLSLRGARISKDNLLVILNCCMKLEVLDARDCVGFYEGNDDILKSAAHIPSVKLEGSSLHGYDDYTMSPGGYMMYF